QRLVPETQSPEPKLLPPYLHARVTLSSTAWRSESDNFWSVSTRDIVTAPIIAAAVAIARFLDSAGRAWSKRAARISTILENPVVAISRTLLSDLANSLPSAAKGQPSRGLSRCSAQT